MDQIVQQSRETMAQGSASFRAATRLFDRPLREDVWALYAWCRYCDDEIDGQELGHGFQPMTRDERLARLQRLRVLTRKAMVGYLDQLAWETEVWVADSPSHMIHLNGERFLGPYPS